MTIKSYERYLDITMNSLSNMLHNCSQRPSVENCNQMLDSMKRMLEEYQSATSKEVNIQDYR